MTTNSEALYNFFLSGVAIHCWIVSLVFFLFWKKSRDKFFCIFAIAFAVLGIERLILILRDPSAESSPQIYLIRSLAYLLIIIGIIQKNKADA